MFTRRMALLSALGVLWGPLLAVAGRVEADQEKDYPLAKDNGPWMIMVASFYAKDTSDEARRNVRAKAKELALEIRRELKIPAYTYEMHSNFGKDVKAVRYRRPKVTSWREEDGPPPEMAAEAEDLDVNDVRTTTRVREFDQVAVLAGNYANIDQARQVLESKVHAFVPKSVVNMFTLPPKDGKAAPGRQVMLLPEKAKNRPLWRAFATPNPFVPREYLQAQNEDPLILQMNRGPLSLFDCPGKYSVVVATFAGRTMVEYHAEKLKAFERRLATEEQDRLERAAVDAFELAKALREAGWEAYVFHERNASMVAVGSFQNATDPWLKKTIETFKPTEPKGGAQVRPKRLGRFQFSANPLPITVPRRDTAS